MFVQGCSARVLVLGSPLIAVQLYSSNKNYMLGMQVYCMRHKFKTVHRFMPPTMLGPAPNVGCRHGILTSMCSNCKLNNNTGGTSR